MISALENLVGGGKPLATSGRDYANKMQKVA
jgi:hypothetical protein